MSTEVSIIFIDPNRDGAIASAENVRLATGHQDVAISLQTFEEAINDQELSPLVWPRSSWIGLT